MQIQELLVLLNGIKDQMHPETEVLISQDMAPGLDFKVEFSTAVPVNYRKVWLVPVNDGMAHAVRTVPGEDSNH